MKIEDMLSEIVKGDMAQDDVNRVLVTAHNQQRRETIATAILAGYAANPQGGLATIEEATDSAVEMADMLIEKLDEN